jgi:hypothetical protein
VFNILIILRFPDNSSIILCLSSGFMRRSQLCIWSYLPLLFDYLYFSKVKTKWIIIPKYWGLLIKNQTLAWISHKYLGKSWNCIMEKALSKVFNYIVFSMRFTVSSMRSKSRTKPLFSSFAPSWCKLVFFYVWLDTWAGYTFAIILVC